MPKDGISTALVIMPATNPFILYRKIGTTTNTCLSITIRAITPVATMAQAGMNMMMTMIRVIAHNQINTTIVTILGTARIKIAASTIKASMAKKTMTGGIGTINRCLSFVKGNRNHPLISGVYSSFHPGTRPMILSRRVA